MKQTLKQRLQGAALGLVLGAAAIGIGYPIVWERVNYNNNWSMYINATVKEIETYRTNGGDLGFSRKRHLVTIDSLGKEVDVDFISAPEYKGCFFMSDAMFTQLMREAGGQSVDAQITFRGDSRTGYSVSFYRLGK